MLILYDADVAEAVRKLLGAPTRPQRLARLRLRFALSEYGRLEKRIQKLSSEPLEPQVAQAGRVISRVLSSHEESDQGRTCISVDD